MSNLLRHLESKAMPRTRPDQDRGGIRCGITREETGEVLPGEFPTQREHRLMFRATVSYWANDAQQESATRIAERALVRQVYGDLLRTAHELRVAVMNEDRDHANRLCSELIEIVEGP